MCNCLAQCWRHAGTVAAAGLRLGAPVRLGIRDVTCLSDVERGLGLGSTIRARLTLRRRRARRRSARMPSAGSSATSASWPSCARPRRRRCRARRRPCAAGASALPRSRRSRACWAACTPRWPRARGSGGRGRGAALHGPARRAGASGRRACSQGCCAPASPACAPHSLRPEPRRQPCGCFGVRFKLTEERG